ncbi:uncharacterized protein N7477_006121 [Penicillium maclennaniae]|uniref:uncharacterized protein n=1 Tax=Penicillium maclennaniae TaxID=1343394 RepID=UPI00254182CC|nr:uncharacterized protein N7477_006121 [Penicillium maclennaniae]KAJ5670758.1 hypothetical protein N7477_006121 [Penicillium maclennaniae]
MSDVTNPPTAASGRGKQLNKTEEEALIRISKERQGSRVFPAHRKAFWLEISDLLFKETGRVYSWQSCRRRMVAWESLTPLAPYMYRDKPIYPPDEEIEGIENEATQSLAVTKGDFSPPINQHEESDNDLPQTPFVLRRSMNTTVHPSQRGVADLRCNIIDLVQCTMTSLEAQVNCLTNALVTDENSCEGIIDALNHLKGEVTKAIGDYKRSS